MDNIEIAILTKLNTLADRYGLKPYEYVATLSRSVDMSGCGVTFRIPGETDTRQEIKVRSMYAALGVDRTGVLKGGEIVVMDAIDNAMSLAPKPRRR